MQNPKHVVIVAGEESGDAHAAHLIKQLYIKYPNITVSGIGGRHMAAAGAELISDLAHLGVTGFTEVISSFRVIKKAFNAIKHHLIHSKPDCLILVDYPGFNLRLARFAKKKLGIKIIYYISPQIWAWKANRIHTIKECVDVMAVILPFEKKLYEAAGVPVHFVGHPLVNKVSLPEDISSERQKLNLPLSGLLFALLPGSRVNEIKQHMPVLRNTIIHLLNKNPSCHFVIPVAGTLSMECIASYFIKDKLPVTLIADKALECMKAADFVIVASGTASLECALLEKPMCIIYKSSWLTYYVAMKVLRVKLLGLCNLLSQKMIVPEFLYYDCNPTELSRFITGFMQNPQQQQKMLHQLKTLRKSLSSEQSDCSLLELVEISLGLS
jgi:lipid-A-disaccharide synthase